VVPQQETEGGVGAAAAGRRRRVRSVLAFDRSGPPRREEPPPLSSAGALASTVHPPPPRTSTAPASPAVVSLSRRHRRPSPKHASSPHAPHTLGLSAGSSQRCMQLPSTAERETTPHRPVLPETNRRVRATRKGETKRKKRKEKKSGVAGATVEAEPPSVGGWLDGSPARRHHEHGACLSCVFVFPRRRVHQHSAWGWAENAADPPRQPRAARPTSIAASSKAVARGREHGRSACSSSGV